MPPSQGTCQNERQAPTDIGAADVERDGVHGHAPRHLPRSRLATGFSDPVGQGVFHRLAGRSGYGILHHAVGASPHGSDRRFDRWSALIVVRLLLPAGFRACLRVLCFPHLRTSRRRLRYPVPDDRRGRDLTPWSTTYYSTRSADLLRSPQAEYRIRPSEHSCHPK